MCKYLMNNSLLAIAFFVALSVSASWAPAAEWGSIKGRFLVDGAPPAPKPLVVTKDQFCIDKMPANEAIVVGEGGALANAVVYVRVSRGKTIETHPDYAPQLGEPVTLDNNGCQFVPHITLIRKGQTLVIKNSDPVGHNTNLTAFRFNQTIPSSGDVQTKIQLATPLPMPVNCNIHPWMQSYILALDHPYMAASAEDGTFEIKNIPAGKHEFQFWHESPGYLKDLKIGTGKSNRQGRVQLSIAAGQTLDLGDIKVPASMLK
jgi:hypothetical protein